MDLGVLSHSMDAIKCCDCGCNCSLTNVSSSSWIRSVKRKHEEIEKKKRFSIPELDEDLFSNAKVQIENECELLRETLITQQQSIQDLYEELDEERNAASTAANEAMLMILKLQREKAQITMELRQFKLFVEEKMEHDQQEVLVLEDLLYKREQTIQALTFEAQAYKHKMMSYGFTETEVETEVDEEKNMLSRNQSMIDIDTEFDAPTYDYPPIKCNLNEIPDSLEDDIDVEKYTLVDSSHGREQFKSLERRIRQMERNPSIVQSPRRQRHFRRISTGSSSSNLGTSKELIRSYFSIDSPRFNSGNSKNVEDISYAKGKKSDLTEIGDDDMINDRVYTIDCVHQSSPPKEEFRDDYVVSPRKKMNQVDLSDPDIMKLYMRLQALEADRESMRQAIVSMRTEKTQMVLLKELTQHLSNDVATERRLPLRKVSTGGAFTFMSVFKWILSIVFWRRKARKSKYMKGISTIIGLQVLLEKTPRIQQWRRCLTRTQL